MKIVLTKHSKQRREHYEIKKDEEIIPWVEYLIEKYKIKNIEDGKYKIRGRGNVIVFKKKKYTVIVITIRGFNIKRFENRENYKLKFSKIIDDEFRIYRKNYKGVTKVAGKIENDIIQLKKEIYDIYNIPKNLKKKELIQYDERTERWFLKDFKRKEEHPIYRKDENGKFYKCGTLIGEQVRLHSNLFGKLNIPRNKFYSGRKDEMVYYKKGKYILNEFPRTE